MKKLSSNTIERWLSTPNSDIELIAAEACRYANVPIETFEKVFAKEYAYYSKTLLKACIGNKKFPVDVIKKWADIDNSNFKLAAMISSKNVDVPFEVIKKGIENPDPAIHMTALEACQGKNIPYQVIEEYLDKFKYYAANACIGNNIPIDVLRNWMTKEGYFRVAAMNSCIERDVPTDLIVEGLENSKYEVMIAAARACKGKNIPIEVLREYINDEELYISHEIIKSLEGTFVPMEDIFSWLEQENDDVRIAALNFCKGKIIPSDYIDKFLDKSSPVLRIATMQFCSDEHIKVPLIRTIEPPEKVYKKCLFNVILIIAIPETAQVRGNYGEKCRASEARIVGVIGETYGEKLGISIYDHTVMYEKGDYIKIENFDYSDAECSTGFHFFNTLEEALKY